MTINFHFLEKTTLTNRSGLRNHIQLISTKEKCSIELVDFIFCSDEYLLTINKNFLKHDYYTDIITFDLTQKGANSKVSEIYISIDRVKENALQFSTNFKRELHRVIFHGILHLCGYKDKKAAEQSIMRKKEEEYLHLYFKK